MNQLTPQERRERREATERALLQMHAIYFAQAVGIGFGITVVFMSPIIILLF